MSRFSKKSREAALAANDRNEKGQFNKGHSQGKKPGTKSQKLKDWEILRESVLGHHTNQFNEKLNALWASDKRSDHKAAINIYLQILKHFKPQVASINEPEEDDAPLRIEIVQADN